MCRQRQLQQMQAGEWSQRKDLEMSSLKAHYETVTQVRSTLRSNLGWDGATEKHVMNCHILVVTVYGFCMIRHP